MSQTTYKRSKARGAGGRWLIAQEAVKKPVGRGRRFPRVGKGPRTIRNTRRGEAGGSARGTRGRKHVIQRRTPRRSSAPSA